MFSLIKTLKLIICCSSFCYLYDSLSAGLVWFAWRLNEVGRSTAMKMLRYLNLASNYSCRQLNSSTFSSRQSHSGSLMAFSIIGLVRASFNSMWLLSDISHAARLAGGILYSTMPVLLLLFLPLFSWVFRFYFDLQITNK